jgi:hypothetical protein
MIQIDENLFVKSNARELILCEKGVVEKGDNAGNETLKEIGYFPNLKFLAYYLFNRRLQAIAQSEEYVSLTQVEQQMVEWVEEFERNLSVSFKEAVGS